MKFVSKKFNGPISTLRCVPLIRKDADLSELSFIRCICIKNNLLLNVSKYKTMSFHRKRHPMNFSYQLNNEEVFRVKEVMDLFDEKLSFNKHIDITISKAYSRHGFCNESNL